MKKLADYKGEDAIDLWRDLLKPISIMFRDPEIAEVVRGKNPPLVIAEKILDLHKKEAIEVLTRIDPAEITGLNILSRVLNIINEIKDSEEYKDFFLNAGQAKTENGSSGNATESTEVAEN